MGLLQFLVGTILLSRWEKFLAADVQVLRHVETDPDFTPVDLNYGDPSEVPVGEGDPDSLVQLPCQD
jgi:hypothetical protein